MSKIETGRRTFLRGVLGGVAISLALPRLEFMLNSHGTAYADGAALPRRFGVWAFANGVHLKRWVPAEIGSTWELSDQLAPLAPVRDYLTCVSGLDIPQIGRGHATQHTYLMTGVPPAGRNDSEYTAARASIDQLVADEIGKNTKFKSLELAVTHAQSGERGSAFHHWSHSGPNSPNVYARSCKEVFTRLTAAAGANAATDAAAVAALERQMRLQRSVLDVVKEDGRALNNRLGASDKKRLEQHMEGLRALERRLQGGDSMTNDIVRASCKAPVAPADALVAGAGDYDERVQLINKTMAELVAFAFACDLTRVVTYQIVQPGSELKSDRIVGSLRNPGVHDLSHFPIEDPRLHKVVLHYMSELRVFIDVLKATPEGDGNLLDNSAIMVANDCSEGSTHLNTNTPLLVVGRAGGLKSGQHIASQGPAMKVPFTLARAVGAMLPSFGDGPSKVSDPMSELLG